MGPSDGPPASVVSFAPPFPSDILNIGMRTPGDEALKHNRDNIGYRDLSNSTQSAVPSE